MKIVLHDVNGVKDKNAYYRKVAGNVDFMNTDTFATNVSQEEAEQIMKYSKKYCKEYHASHMSIEE